MRRKYSALQSSLIKFLIIFPIRHIYTDSTDRFVIRKFLQEVFKPMERLKDARNKTTRFEVALDIPQMVEYLDMKEEGQFLRGTFAGH